MKKSLIAAAVAGLFVAPVAMADVKLGGELDVNYESFDNGVESGLQGNDTHSRWWIDATDDLGNGVHHVLGVVEHEEEVEGPGPVEGLEGRCPVGR